MLFTFPSRYSCTIGRRGVFRLGGWSPRVRTGFHVPRPTRGPLRTLRLRGCHPLRRTFPGPSASFPAATGLLPFRSPLLGESRLMSFPPGTEMFQFSGFASRSLCIQLRDTCSRLIQAEPKSSSRIKRIGGFPHSEICGSKVAHTSPQLIAGCHVLHRLYVPRHPRIALTSRLRVHTTNDNAGRSRRSTNSAEQRAWYVGVDD